jgi:hypothetical protein
VLAVAKKKNGIQEVHGLGRAAGGPSGVASGVAGKKGEEDGGMDDDGRKVLCTLDVEVAGDVGGERNLA